MNMYGFQTMGEFRALLSLYNIGVEEVRGIRAGKPYRGLVYMALDGRGGKVEMPPIKASVIKGVGIDALEKQMERSGTRLEKEQNRKKVRDRMAAAFENAPTEETLRKRLRAVNIDLFLRRNDAGRITGVTFIDHENRCVMNGSRLGKEFSANVLNEKYQAGKNTASDPHGVSNVKFKTDKTKKEKRPNRRKI